MWMYIAVWNKKKKSFDYIVKLKYLIQFEDIF